MLPLTGHTFYFIPATAIYREKTMPKRSKLVPQNSRHLQLLQACVHSLLPTVTRPSRQLINTAALALQSPVPATVFVTVICICCLPLQLLPACIRLRRVFRSHAVCLPPPPFDYANSASRLTYVMRYVLSLLYRV